MHGSIQSESIVASPSCLARFTTVKTITLRNMDDDLKAALAKEAANHATSLNGAALKVLRVGLGLEKRPRRERNLALEKLAGRWSETDAAEFDQSTAATREIDPDLWR